MPRIEEQRGHMPMALSAWQADIEDQCDFERSGLPGHVPFRESPDELRQNASPVPHALP